MLSKLQRFRDAMERRWKRLTGPYGAVEKKDYHAHLIKFHIEHNPASDTEVRVETWKFYPWVEEK